jgi:glycosyltransferase involved in cell wall biosynthesis
MTTPRKVLFLIDSLGAGGAERSLAESLPGLAEAGIWPIVACFKQRPQGVEQAVRADGFDVRLIRSAGWVPRVREVRSLLAEERPDVVHTTIFDSDIVGRVAAVHTGIPVVTSLVNISYSKMRLVDPNVRAVRLRMAKSLEGWTARHLTAHFHALTEAVKRSAVEVLRIPNERVTVIPRGRDAARLGETSLQRRRDARARLGLARDEDVLVSVGRQEFQKGQRYLLEAMAELRGRPKVKLLVAGRPGHASGELNGFRDRLGLGDRVRFLGHREDIPDILAAADLFVFPSLYEGLGGALIEAMALGLPIVASELEPFREVVEEGRNALLVPAASPERLATAIASVLDDRRLARLFAKRSREIFEERFTLERSTLRMVELYRALLTGVPSRSQPRELAS